MVNSGQTAINGRLTADIDLGDRAVMIGTVDYNYSGTFDGNGHTLTVNLSAQSNCVAPFQIINMATIRNLTVGGTITTSTKFAGGLVAHFQGTGELIVTNCASRGSIEGASTTCCAGMVDNTAESDTFARNHINLAFENCYYLNEFGATNLGPAQKTAEQFASGEVAFLLGAPFGQNIDNGSENAGFPSSPTPPSTRC